MMERMPCSDTVKQTILSQMNDHNSPVLTDKTVHMIMVALVLFDSQDSDIEVRKVHKTTCTMLQGYLNSHSNQLEQGFQTVLKCVKALPTISKTRNQMMAEVAARLYAKKPRLPTSIGNSVRFNWPHIAGESRQFICTVGNPPSQCRSQGTYTVLRVKCGLAD